MQKNQADPKVRLLLGFLIRGYILLLRPIAINL